MDGLHRDHPDNDITIECLDTGLVKKGDFSVLNSIDSDLVYVFCLSNKYSNILYQKFESDVCIEITEPQEFIRRIRLKVKRLIFCHSSGLLHNNVRYYKSNEAAEFNIKDPFKLPFSKDISFFDQDEYRLIFGSRKAFKLKESIVTNMFDFREDAMKGVIKNKLIEIGSLDDIANIRYIHT